MLVDKYDGGESEKNMLELMLRSTELLVVL